MQYITGREWSHLSDSDQDEYIEKAVKFWRKNGFPYPSYDDAKIIREFNSLRDFDSNRMLLNGSELQVNTLGVGLANFFHPQMWHIQVGRYITPYECFIDDKILGGVLRKSLRLSPQKRAAEPSVLRESLRTYTNTGRVSNFRPLVAKAIYERYSKDDDRILDYCAGFSGRLLGALALDRNYVGLDPAKSQIEGLTKTYRKIKKLGLSKSSVAFHRVCAEDWMAEQSSASFDLIFSSPPYFNKEKYSHEATQSFIKYPKYEIWRNQFLYTIIREGHRLLRSGGYFIINICNVANYPIADDCVDIAREFFQLEKTYSLRVLFLPYHNGNGNGVFKYEPIFLFKKE
jgi:16S rRNA G966 N2-methylase RsmD